VSKKSHSKKKNTAGNPVQKGVPKNRIPWGRHMVLALACALAIGIFAQTAQSGFLESISPGAQDSYYNLLVQGFQAGQLNVKRDPSPGLDQLADPYDPAVNTTYLWHVSHLSYELSYYHGKLYLYFGVTPALVLFWPCELITGHYLLHRQAVVIFFSLGFLLVTAMVHGIQRRYFSSVWVMAAGLLALALGTGILEILSSCDVYEVAKSCGFAFVMLALFTVWAALNDPKRQLRWLLLGSLAYALAVGSRPSLLFGIIILLIPVARAWCGAADWPSYHRVILLLAATMIPAALIGAGLLAYNNLRFHNPFEFGWHYQLTDHNNRAARQFSPLYFWTNFRFYFFQPVRWGGRFPFLQGVSPSHLPSGYYGTASPDSGVLLNYPIVWLALAAPLAWKNRSRQEASILRWFIAAVFLLFVTCAATICLFFAGGGTYELDFLPALMLLAVIGIFALERVLADQPARRWLFRAGWGLLLAFTIGFNILASVKAHATSRCLLGNSDLSLNRVDDAIAEYHAALALCPDSAEAHACLGKALCEKGQLDEAVNQCQIALRIQPDFPVTYNNLGYCYFTIGRNDDAIAQFQKALQLKPDFYDAQFNLAYCYLSAGRLDEAIAEYQKGLKVHPTDVSAYYNLGFAYIRKKMPEEAIATYQKALDLDLQSVTARINLSRILATWPDASVRNGVRAVTLAEQANELSGGKDPVVLDTLAAAYAEAGRFPDARSAARQALQLAQDQSNGALATELESEIGLYEKNKPYHLAPDTR
jgi:tetratricopeptide (TPR) repeat protein